MPKVTDDVVRPISLLLTGLSGVGKTAIALQAPQPICVLALDKSSVDIPPGLSERDIFYKTFPPAMIDLSNDKHGRARNIADAIIRDIQLVRDHFTAKKPLTITTMEGGKEDWPTPATLVVEGGDFLAQHMLNLVCARHGKSNPSDFDNVFEAWGLRLVELTAIYDQLTHLPCNVIVTTGPSKETKTSRVNGKVQSEETGVLLPDLGGKMSEEGPRKFHSSLFCYSENGKHYVRTRSNAKFRGFKLGGRFGADEIIDVTTTVDKPVQIWEKLFGKSKA